MIKPEHIWKLLKWVHSLDEKSKSGLRLLISIHEHQGNKRFRHVGDLPKFNAQLSIQSPKAPSKRDELDIMNF